MLYYNPCKITLLFVIQEKVRQRNRKQKISGKRRKGNVMKDNLHEERVMWRKRREYCVRTSQLIEKFIKYQSLKNSNNNNI